MLSTVKANIIFSIKRNFTKEIIRKAFARVSVLIISIMETDFREIGRQGKRAG